MRRLVEASRVRILRLSVAGPGGLVESRPELHMELVMTTRGCSWIPLATRRLIPSWRSPHRTPRFGVSARRCGVRVRRSPKSPVRLALASPRSLPVGAGRPRAGRYSPDPTAATNTRPGAAGRLVAASTCARACRKMSGSPAAAPSGRATPSYWGCSCQSHHLPSPRQRLLQVSEAPAVCPTSSTCRCQRSLESVSSWTGRRPQHVGGVRVGIASKSQPGRARCQGRQPRRAGAERSDAP